MTQLEITLSTLRTFYAANQASIELETAEAALDQYLTATQSLHAPNCRALQTGSSDWCSCARARRVREAEVKYRQSYERIAALDLRFWSSERVEAELRRS
jgi:hypothetical protein